MISFDLIVNSLFFHPKGVTEHEIELSRICRRNEELRAVWWWWIKSAKRISIYQTQKEFCGIEESGSLIETMFIT